MLLLSDELRLFRRRLELFSDSILEPCHSRDDSDGGLKMIVARVRERSDSDKETIVL